MSKRTTRRSRGWLRWLQRLNAGLGVTAAAALVWGVATIARAEEAVAAAGGASETGVGLIAAALCTGIAAVAAGYAVAHVGAASIGAMSERPELAGRTLIFVGLAEGIAIYGLIISVMILGRI